MSFEQQEGESSSSGTTTTEHPPLHPVDTIPETLLAFAKDSRYIQQCQALIQQMVEPWVSRGHFKYSFEANDAFFASTLLYILLVALPSSSSSSSPKHYHPPKGTTLGMEATGIQVSHKARWVTALLLYTGGICLLDRWTRTPANEAQTRELLRGESRRAMHERMRRQMLERSSSRSSTTTTTTSRNDDASTSRNDNLRARISRIDFKDLLRKAAKLLVDTATAPSMGPHTTRSNHGNTQTSFSIGMWLVRLHLAQYLITGKYPSWLFRLAGVQVQPQRQSSAAERIPVKPNTNALLGYLILTQASVTFGRHTFNFVAHWIADYLERRKNKRQAALSDTASSIFPKASKSPIHIERPAKSQSYCSICRLPRSNPAAPSSCGHVCCWDCLIQWTSSVRPECPLCRSPCRPQDIIALHCYQESL